MSDDDVAIDADGRPLPYSPSQVRAIVRRAIVEGKIVLAVLKMPDGNLAAQVFDDRGPTQDTLDILEQTANAYRIALRGN